MSTESEAVDRQLLGLDDSAEVSHNLNPLQSSLCPKCLELRLDQALGKIEPPRECHYQSRFAVRVAEVGRYYRQQSDHGCILCRMLSVSRRGTVSRARKQAQGRGVGDELHVFNLCEDLPWINPELQRPKWWHGHNSLHLAVKLSGWTTEDLKRHGEKNGFLAIRRRGTSQPQIYAPQIVSPRFDLSLARYWLQYCKDHHKRLCSRMKKEITELHLIDCHLLEVIPAPDQADYTALSYVWGAPTTTTDPSEFTVFSGSGGRSLPPSIPAVIADAISVTTGLGFQYLWVDRYCIDQDSHSKHQQIDQMDSIYQNAELTIVAAAGDGPEYGLPGINSRSRCKQQTCTIGDFDIISTMRHPHRTIQSSKWSSRGWTFQEAALSRRNLVFTDDQVYFECNAMNCHESLSSNLDMLHINDKSRFRDLLQVGLFGRTEKQKYGSFDESTLSPAENLLRFKGMVEQYTARDLTYDEDSLNAFQGIIRKFKTDGETVSQLMGVPFCREKVSQFLPLWGDESEKKTTDSFVSGLAWSHSATHRRPRRRLGFPSWSWAGWAGAIQYHERSLYGDSNRFWGGVESISVETGDGLNVSVSAYIDEAKVAPQEITGPCAIHIRALALRASAFSYDNSTASANLRVFQHPARLDLSAGPWDVSGFYQSLLSTNRRKCIYFGHSSSGVMIIVLEAQDHSWSRVGSIFLEDLSGWDFKTLKMYQIMLEDGFTGFPGVKDIEHEVTSFRVI